MFWPKVSRLALGLVFLGASSLFCAGQTSSQPPTDVIRQLPGDIDQRFPTRGISLDLNLPDVGDLAWMTAYAKPPTLKLTTYQSAFYTDNMALSDQDRKESWAWYGWLNLSYVPYSTYRWTPTIALEPFAVRYDRASEEDFEGQTLSFISKLDLNDEKSWWWDLSYALWRFTSQHDDVGEYFKEGELGTSLNWFQSLNQDPSIGIFSHYGIYWHHASPSDFDRLDYQLRLGLVIQPTPRWQGYVYAQPAAYAYLNDTSAWQDRNDFNFTAGASVYWTPVSFLSLGAELVWTRNDSSTDTEDYRVITPILGLYGSLRF